MTLFTTSRPVISVKATARFPASVTADTGLAVTKASGNYNFGFDFTGLTENTSLATPSNYWTLVYNEASEEYEQVRVDALVDYTIDTRRGIGDADATILTTDRYVELTASLSTDRTWTLPAASGVTGGVHIIIQDAAGGISSSNTLIVQRAGSDTINGATSITFDVAYDGAIFYSDGTSKWSYVRRPSTVTVASGKTVTFNNTLTFSGTDSSSVALGAGGTVAYTANKLSAFAATTSAELAGVISDETGSGALVFASSPTLITPALGTPASGTLTNCTGLPVASGISGFGTGIASALAINTGSAGAPVLFDGALGTPSSGTLTNATGLPISTGVSGLGTGVATFLATPSSANLKSALTDETGSGGSAVFATGPTITGLNLAAGSTSVAPINLASGTNLTSATAGAIEYDGTCFYGTPATSNRGVIGVEHFIILTSTNTLTNNTSAQPIFDGGGGPANGAITLPVGTYLFEGFYNLSGLNGGSKNIAFGFAGTATVGSILYRWQTNDTSAFDYANVVATTSATNTISGSLSAMPFCLNGVIRITGAGTVIPQITQVTLSAAASVLVNSYISFKAIGSDTVASLGNVS